MSIDPSYSVVKVVIFRVFLGLADSFANLVMPWAQVGLADRLSWLIQPAKLGTTIA
jgi:hypothetical protein